jgi:hypothetical protein
MSGLTKPTAHTVVTERVFAISARSIHGVAWAIIKKYASLQALVISGHCRLVRSAVTTVTAIPVSPMKGVVREITLSFALRLRPDIGGIPISIALSAVMMLVYATIVFPVHGDVPGVISSSV